MDAVQLATAGDCQKSYDQLMAEWRWVYLELRHILIARERAYVQGWELASKEAHTELRPWLRMKLGFHHQHTPPTICPYYCLISVGHEASKQAFVGITRKVKRTHQTWMHCA